MSCFICDDAHISALAAYGVNHAGITRAKLYAALSRNDIERLDNETDEEVLADILYRANLVSFTSRYQGRHLDTVSPFVFDRDAAIKVRIGATSAVAIIKAAHCFAYQACDDESWDASHAKRFIDAIMDAATRKIPGYDEAAWGAP